MQIFKSTDSEVNYRNFVKLLGNGKKKTEILSILDIHEQTFYKYFTIAKKNKHIEVNKFYITKDFYDYEKTITLKINNILIDNPYDDNNQEVIKNEI